MDTFMPDEKTKKKKKSGGGQAEIIDKRWKPVINL